MAKRKYVRKTPTEATAAEVGEVVAKAQRKLEHFEDTDPQELIFQVGLHNKAILTFDAPFTVRSLKRIISTMETFVQDLEEEDRIQSQATQVAEELDAGPRMAVAE